MEEIRLRAQRGEDSERRGLGAGTTSGSAPEDGGRRRPRRRDTVGLDREFRHGRLAAGFGRAARSDLGRADRRSGDDCISTVPIVGRRPAQGCPLDRHWARAHADRALKLGRLRIRTRWNCAATFVTGVGSWGSHPTPRRPRLCWRAPRLILKLPSRSLRRRRALGAACQHLYNQSGDQVDVKLAARRAYEEDAYLSNADVILSRLFYSSYDLGQFSDAARLVRRRQTAGSPRTTSSWSAACWLMTTKGRRA